MLTEEDLRIRWRSASAFVYVGVASVVVGGLVAAATRPTGLEHGSWLAAYLVLVSGVAQIGLGAGQAWLARTPPSRGTTGWELLLWNGGDVAVVAGTLAAAPPAVDVGGLALLAALVLFLAGVRRARTADGLLLVYRLLTLVVAVGIPIGLVLSGLRHGWT